MALHHHLKNRKYGGLADKILLRLQANIVLVQEKFKALFWVENFFGTAKLLSVPTKLDVIIYFSNFTREKFIECSKAKLFRLLNK